MAVKHVKFGIVLAGKDAIKFDFGLGVCWADDQIESYRMAHTSMRNFQFYLKLSNRFALGIQ